VHTAVVAGDDPVIMLTAPIPATKKALARSGPADLAPSPSGALERDNQLYLLKSS
jgi:hypothetical protein